MCEWRFTYEWAVSSTHLHNHSEQQLVRSSPPPLPPLTSSPTTVLTFSILTTLASSLTLTFANPAPVEGTALAIPSAWHVLPARICEAHPLSSFRTLLWCHGVIEGLPWPSYIKYHPQPHLLAISPALYFFLVFFITACYTFIYLSSCLLPLDYRSHDGRELVCFHSRFIPLL